MKLKIHISGKNILVSFCAIVIMIVIACCAMDITKLEQPTEATANTVMTVNMQVTYTNPHSDRSGKLIIAVLAPTGWNLGKNNNLTMSYSSDNGYSGKMEVVPSSVLEKQSQLTWPEALKKKFGYGDNFGNDLEWVAFQSVESRTYNAKVVDIIMKMKVGVDNNNTLVKLAYVTSGTYDGLADYDPQFAEAGHSYMYYQYKSSGTCLIVDGGTTGETNNFCTPSLAAVEPARALDDDFVTIAFDGTASPTDLDGKAFVRLKATAITTDNTSYTVEGLTDKTKMVQTTSSSNVYNLTIWPRAYFGVPEGKTIDRIQYTFTSEDGTIEVGVGNTTVPFVYKLRCPQ